MTGARATAVALLAVSLAGCAATYEQSIEADLAAASRGLDPLPPRGEPRAGLEVDGSLESYLAAAMRQSPALRAAFERWRAATHRISQARRLPEPTLTYGYFVQSVETRVGPQRHRLGLRQSFPWPSKLTAGADSASSRARARQRQFEAAALGLKRRIASAYWRLWLIGETRRVQRDQLEVLGALSSATRARIEVGSATLADLNQVDLARARLEDSLAGLDEAAAAASAGLVAVVGAAPGSETPIEPRALPQGGAPAAPRPALLDAALAHPSIDVLDLMRESSEARAHRAFADRLPGFTVGVDWIETGEAGQPDVPGSGTDPVMVMVGIRLPLWQHVYGGEEAEARALGSAFEAEAADAESHAAAELDQALAELRDADRRIGLYHNTLLPQAEAAYASVVGAYQTGRSTVAAGLIAQRELLDLELGLARARADHAVAWARLEQVVGRVVERAAEEP